MTAEPPGLIRDPWGDGRCPHCGAVLGGFPPEDTCAGIRCTNCDYVAVVTTNPNRPECDRTLYSVFVEINRENAARAVAATGSIFGIGIREAKELLDGGHPIQVDVTAMEIRRLHRELKARGLQLRTEPEYRWRLE